MSTALALTLAVIPEAPPKVPKNRAQARFRDSFSSYRTTLPTALGAQPILAKPARYEMARASVVPIPIRRPCSANSPVLWLSFTGGGRLDLYDNSLILDYTGGSQRAGLRHVRARRGDGDDGAARPLEIGRLAQVFDRQIENNGSPVLPAATLAAISRFFVMPLRYSPIKMKLYGALRTNAPKARLST